MVMINIFKKSELERGEGVKKYSEDFATGLKEPPKCQDLIFQLPNSARFQ
jgi:hypothetical protein